MAVRTGHMLSYPEKGSWQDLFLIPLWIQPKNRPTQELTRWEQDLNKERLEQPLFERRGQIEAYLDDERLYA